MNIKIRKHIVRLALVTTLLLVAVSPAFATATPVVAEGGDEYQLTWFTVGGGGGGMSSGDGVYSMSATAGEPATEKISNGEYSLQGGFWGALQDFLLYLPLIRK
ncbi:MAG: hypothetical protein HY782_24105 [Chloroflexi bacterium]|nr:hypothetical protein [Chloroflexota bacterium]